MPSSVDGEEAGKKLSKRRKGLIKAAKAKVSWKWKTQVSESCGSENTEFLQ